MDHTKQLGTDPILKLIIRFSIPSIISMFVNAIYNIVDRIFVGQFVGEDALGGLTITFPLMMVAFAIGALFAVGGATLVSIKFGERNVEHANQVYGNLLVLTAISCLSMIILGEIFLPPLLMLVGATQTVLPYAQDYMQIILPGLFFQLSSFTMSSLARSEGNPRLAMNSQLVSALTNIVLDYLFIGPLGMGVSGAAIATIIGQFTGFAMLGYHFFLSKKSILTLYIKNLKLKLSIVKSICITGMSSFVINLGTSVSASFTNIALSAYGGDAAIVSMGAINSLVTLVIMPLFGLLQGVGPIMGYNYGMGKHDRVKKALYSSILLGTSFALIMFAILELFPEATASLFLDPTSPTMLVCASGLRLQALFLPLFPANILVAAYFQSTHRGARALALSLSRQALIILAVMVIPLLWALTGVWIAGPIAEMLGVILAFCFLAFEKRTVPSTIVSEEI